jgi:hypothetical protein
VKTLPDPFSLSSSVVENEFQNTFSMLSAKKEDSRKTVLFWVSQAVYSPAAFFNAAALSVRSHGNSMSSRPK